MTNSHAEAVVKGIHQSPFDSFIWTIILRWEKSVPLTNALPS